MVLSLCGSNLVLKIAKLLITNYYLNRYRNLPGFKVGTLALFNFIGTFHWPQKPRSRHNFLLVHHCLRHCAAAPHFQALDFG